MNSLHYSDKESIKIVKIVRRFYSLSQHFADLPHNKGNRSKGARNNIQVPKRWDAHLSGIFGINRGFAGNV